jgi:hypothetical protein
MSYMRVTKSYGHNAICDVCGFKFKNFELKKRWDGFMVCKNDYEMRHPMDFYTTRNDAHLLPWTRSDSNGTDVGPQSQSVNWALDLNGGVPTASSSNPTTDINWVNNGELSGFPSGSSQTWQDGTPSEFPDWLQITLGQIRPVNRVKIYSRQNDLTSSTPPTDATLATIRAVKDFSIQVYIGGNWVTVANIYDNSMAIREVTFGTVYTDAVRMVCYASRDGLRTRVVEFEVYGTIGGIDTTAVAGEAIAGRAVSGRT